MSLIGIHHLRYAVENPEDFTQFLISKFGFSYYAIRGKRSDPTSPLTIVLKHRAVLFLICQRSQLSSQDVNGNEKVQFLGGNLTYPVDTCCDICFKCNNVDEIARKAASLDPTAVTSRDEVQVVLFCIKPKPIYNIYYLDLVVPVFFNFFCNNESS